MLLQGRVDVENDEDRRSGEGELGKEQVSKTIGDGSRGRRTAILYFAILDINRTRPSRARIQADGPVMMR